MAAIDACNHSLRLATRFAVLTLIEMIVVFPLVFLLVPSLQRPTQRLADTA